jgi:hypothetical protein
MHRVIAAMVLLGVACSSGKRDTTPAGAAGGTSAAPRIAAGVPANSGVVTVLSLPWTVGELLSRGWIVRLGEEARSALEQELEEFLRGEVGIDLMNIRSATGFMFVDGDEEIGAAVILPGVEGSLAKSAVMTLHGTPVVELGDEVYAAVRADTIVIGNRAGVDAALAVLAGASPGLPEDSRIQSLLRAEGRGAHFAVAGDASRLPELPPEVREFGVQAGVLTWSSRGPRLVALGEQVGLERFAQVMRTQMEGWISLVNVSKRTLKMSGRIAEAIGAIVTAHEARALARELEPTVAADRLTIELELSTDDAGFQVAVVGMVAAAAIPAFFLYLGAAERPEPPQPDEALPLPPPPPPPPPR